MRVFLDTNIIMEYYGHRQLFDDAESILMAAHEGAIDAVISEGSLYTLTYLLGLELKKQGIHEPEKTSQVRSTLSALLSFVGVVRLDDQSLQQSVQDEAFADIEDCYQYYCAIANGCDYLVTINLKHFKPSSSHGIEIIGASQFAKRFIS